MPWESNIIFLPSRLCSSDVVVVITAAKKNHCCCRDDRHVVVHAIEVEVSFSPCDAAVAGCCWWWQRPVASGICYYQADVVVLFYSSCCFGREGRTNSMTSDFVGRKKREEIWHGSSIRGRHTLMKKGVTTSSSLWRQKVIMVGS